MADSEFQLPKLSPDLVKMFRRLLEKRVLLDRTARELAQRCLPSRPQTYIAQVKKHRCNRDLEEQGQCLSFDIDEWLHFIQSKLKQGRGKSLLLFHLLDYNSDGEVSLDDLNSSLGLEITASVPSENQNFLDESSFKLVEKEVLLNFDSTPTFQGSKHQSEPGDRSGTEWINFIKELLPCAIAFERERLQLYDSPGFSLPDFHSVLTMLTPQDRVLKALLESNDIEPCLIHFLHIEKTRITLGGLRRALTPVCRSETDLGDDTTYYFDIVKGQFSIRSPEKMQTIPEEEEKEGEEISRVQKVTVQSHENHNLRREEPESPAFQKKNHETKGHIPVLDFKDPRNQQSNSKLIKEGPSKALEDHNFEPKKTDRHSLLSSQSLSYIDLRTNRSNYAGTREPATHEPKHQGLQKVTSGYIGVIDREVHGPSTVYLKPGKRLQQGQSSQNRQSAAARLWVPFTNY